MLPIVSQVKSFSTVDQYLSAALSVDSAVPLTSPVNTTDHSATEAVAGLRCNIDIPYIDIMSSIPIQIAETIQTASINKHPDADHDINPSTAASVKIPVTRHHQTPDSQTSLDDLDDVDSISSSVLGSELGDDDYNIYRQRRRMSMPPLPDLRFEQSYLASISGADTWGKIAFITIRDQVIYSVVLFSTLSSSADSVGRYSCP
jgi:hypothetical protein